MKKILAIVISIATLSILWITREPIVQGILWMGDRDQVVASMTDYGAWGPVVLFILFVLQVFFAFIPGQALMVASGYVYGFWGGFLISWLSLFAGGQAAFYLARYFGRPFAERWVAPKILDRWDKASHGQGVGFYTVSLVLPLFPNDAMCYVAGLGKISSQKFSLANTLGRGMACLATSAAGAFGDSLSWQAWAVIVTILCLIGIAIQIINKKTNLFAS